MGEKIIPNMFREKKKEKEKEKEKRSKPVILYKLLAKGEVASFEAY